MLLPNLEKMRKKIPGQSNISPQGQPKEFERSTAERSPELRKVAHRALLIFEKRRNVWMQLKRAKNAAFLKREGWKGD